MSHNSNSGHGSRQYVNYGNDQDGRRETEKNSGAQNTSPLNEWLPGARRQVQREYPNMTSEEVTSELGLRWARKK